MWYNTKVQQRRTLRSHRLRLMTAVNNRQSDTKSVCSVVRRILRTIFIYVLEVSAISTKELQINEEIRAKEVRIVGEDGEQVGVMQTAKALELAYEKDLDLVLIAPNAEPPVCRIMDYGKYRFERDKKEKEARKKQTVVEVKEIQLSCRIDTHDFETKVKHAHRFLGDGNKVRVVVKFRGREMSHLDIGRELLEKFEEACKELGSVDKRPALEGRFMSMIVNPVKQPNK